MDYDSDDSPEPPLLHLNMRQIHKKTQPPRPKSPADAVPNFALSAKGIGPRPKTTPAPSIHPSIQQQGAYTIDPTSEKLAASRDKRRRSSIHRSGSINALATTPAQQIGALPIPLNKRDTAALKMGRTLMNEISNKYDQNNTDDPMAHSRFFIDRWLASFDTEAKKVNPFAMEMLSRMTTLENQISRSVSPLLGGRISPHDQFVETSGRLTTNPQKPLVVLACQVLDAMIDDGPGDELPVLQCLRKAFYPALFMDDKDPEFDETTPVETIRQTRFSDESAWEDSNSKSYMPRRMWFESDAEEKLVLAHKQIEELQRRNDDVQHKHDQLKFELDDRLKSEAEYRDKISDLTMTLEEIKREAETHSKHKESLRNMLDAEQKNSRMAKMNSNKSLKAIGESERARASARIFKMQVSQKKALTNLKDMETKYKRARTMSEEKDNSIYELEAKVNHMKDDVIEAQQKHKLDLVGISNERDKLLEEVEGYKDLVAKTKELYTELQEQHFKVCTEHDKLQSDVMANGDAQEMAKEYERVIAERMDSYNETLSEKDKEIADLKKTIEFNINNLDVLKLNEGSEEGAGGGEKSDAKMHFVDKEEADRLKEEIAAKTRINVMLKKDFEAQIEELKAERNHIKEQMESEVEKAREEMKVMMANESFYMEKLQENEELLALRDSELKAARSSLEKELLQKIAVVEDKMEQAKAQMEQAKADLAQFKKENRQLKDELKVERRRIREERRTAGEEDVSIDTSSLVEDFDSVLDLVEEAESEEEEKEVEVEVEVKEEKVEEKEEVKEEAVVVVVEEEEEKDATQIEEVKPKSTSGEMVDGQVVAELKQRIEKLEEECAGATSMYEAANERSGKSAEEVGTLKRKVADLEEICGKLEDTLKRTATSAVGSGVMDMISQLEGRKKLQNATKKINKLMGMGLLGNGGGKKKAGGIFGGLSGSKGALPVLKKEEEKADENNEEKKEEGGGEGGASVISEDAMSGSQVDADKIKAETELAQKKLEKEERAKAKQIEAEEAQKKMDEEAAAAIAEAEKQQKLAEEAALKAAEMQKQHDEEIEKRVREETERKIAEEHEKMEEALKQQQEELEAHAEEERLKMKEKLKAELASQAAALAAKTAAEAHNQANSEIEKLQAQMKAQQEKAQVEKKALEDLAEHEKKELEEEHVSLQKHIEEENKLKAQLEEAMKAQKEAEEVKVGSEKLKAEAEEMEKKAAMMAAESQRVAKEAQESAAKAKADAEAFVEEEKKNAKKMSMMQKIGMMGKDSHAAKLARENKLVLEEAQKKAKEAEEMIARVKREAEEEKAKWIEEQRKLKEAEEGKKREEEMKRKKKEAEGEEFGKGIETSKKAQLIKSMLNQQKDLMPMVGKNNAAAMKKVAELQKKIDKLRKDLENYGGWKNALYLSGGSVDLEFDLEPWPQKQIIAILKEMKGYLVKAMKEEKNASAKAFREVDHKNMELGDGLKKSERTNEKLRQQMARLRGEMDRVEEDKKKREAEEQMMEMQSGGTEGGKKAGEMGKEELMEEIKKMRRQAYRERLGVSELLKGLDKLSDSVGELCVSGVGANIVADEEEEVDEVARERGGEKARSLLVQTSDSESRKVVNGGVYSLSKRAAEFGGVRGKGGEKGGRGVGPETTERSGIGGVPRTFGSAVPAPGGVKRVKGEAPRLKHTPDLMGETHVGKSMLPYLVTKKKQMTLLSKFLGKRILFGENLKEYSDRVKNLNNLDKVESLAKLANSKLVEHQGAAMKLQKYLDEIFETVDREMSEEAETYHALKMKEMGNASKPMLKWAEQRGGEEFMYTKDVRSKSPLAFARLGEHSSNVDVTRRKGSPPRKFEVGAGDDRLF
ncbi:hypothetical protein TL16_g00654 [Triparma laevis f. inornata]|uniref:Uncharacterized protein n=1 Tax=Triparma laevis f. inornata TaxID=1714386 RepID=A0A9W7DT96_9STRA|nr:hypothetical protein TL16_g00654 [Triparma laevis f. inornata]